MKNCLKAAFFLVLTVIFVSCGEKKSIYDQYADHPGNENGTPATDNDNAKESGGKTQPDEDDASDNDESNETEIAVDEDSAPVPDDDILAEDNDTGTDSDTEEPMNCTGFSLDPDDKLSGEIPSTIYHIKIADNILGDPDHEDIFELRLDHKRIDGDPYVAEGTYDLAYGYNGHNTNYWKCWECVSVTQDSKTDSEKFYFQKKGTLTIESVDNRYNFSGTLSAVLVESELGDYWVSSPVKNGDCIEIETSFEATTFCYPDCSGKETGESDGCGGTCINCGGTGECSSNRNCDPGYYCGNDCQCYIENSGD